MSVSANACPRNHLNLLNQIGHRPQVKMAAAARNQLRLLATDVHSGPLLAERDLQDAREVASNVDSHLTAFGRQDDVLDERAQGRGSFEPSPFHIALKRLTQSIHLLPIKVRHLEMEGR